MSTDWSQVRNRLSVITAALERGAAPPSDQVARILNERARRLAEQPRADDAPGEGIEILEFRLAAEQYAVESSFVRAVQPLKGFVAVPAAPDFVPGIVNVRGRVFPVIDLKTLFELAGADLNTPNRIILVQHQAAAFGILADGIIGIRKLPVREIQPALPTLTGIRQAYLRGVSSEGTVVLDATRLLADETLKISER
jgi:purine-binding chemotaxis protein CheW